MPRQYLKKRVSYSEQIAVFDEVLERVEKGFDEFKRELKTDLKEMHEVFVRKDEFKFQIESLNVAVKTVDTKVDDGFKKIEQKLGEGRAISEWIKKNAYILIGVAWALQYAIDHVDLLKKIFP